MRAIFLDIDGVICCNQFGRLEDRKLQLLRGVVQQTGAKVVLSTDWRRVPKLKAQLIGTLRDYGMDVIGATPMRPPWQPVRPQEITDWLASYNQQAVAANSDPITNFVAVDDRSLLQESGGDGLRGRFVHTRNISGLTDKCAQRMASLLLTGEPGASPIPGLLHEQTRQSVATPPPPTAGSSSGHSFLFKDARASPPNTATSSRQRPALTSSLGGINQLSERTPPTPPPKGSSPAGLSTGVVGGGFEARSVAIPNYSAAEMQHPMGLASPSMGGMSQIQRSIFRGGHDATGRLNAGPPGALPQRGHTAAGGRNTGSTTLILGGPLTSPVAIHEGRLPQMRGPGLNLNAPGSRVPAIRSQTASGASVGYGRPMPVFGAPSHSMLSHGGAMPVPPHMRPPGAMRSIK